MRGDFTEKMANLLFAYIDVISRPFDVYAAA